MKTKQWSHQPHLPGFNFKSKALVHGGEFAKNKRKTERPFDPKQALHVVLRSEKAKGQCSLLHPKHCNHIQSLLVRLKKRWEIKVYRYANVGNHLHLLIQAPSRTVWQRFIREFSGGVAMIVTGARKGHALPRAKKSALPESAQRGFWDHLVFTRIVQFGRDFKVVARYVLINLWEASGISMRKYLKAGYRICEMSEDGVFLLRPG